MPNFTKKNPGAGFDTPWTWFIVFHTDCHTWWLNRLVPGQFKHVTAVGFSSRTRTWMFFDPAMERTKLYTAFNDDEGERLLAQWFAGATVVEMHVSPHAKRAWRPGGWCVPQVAHLMGLRSGAVLPGGLLRDCLRNGGRIIHDESVNAEARQDPHRA